MYKLWIILWIICYHMLLYYTVLYDIVLHYILLNSIVLYFMLYYITYNMIYIISHLCVFREHTLKILIQHLVCHCPMLLVLRPAVAGGTKLALALEPIAWDLHRKSAAIFLVHSHRKHEKNVWRCMKHQTSQVRSVLKTSQPPSVHHQCAAGAAFHIICQAQQDAPRQLSREALREARCTWSDAG